MSNLPIIEVFTSIQGEGVYMGVPSVFVRVSGCNLRCVFQNSLCDTPYSSFIPEKPKFEVSDVINEFKKHPNVGHLVLTGGEPTLYNIREFLDELFQGLKEIGVTFPKITVETNGTIPIKPDIRIWLYSISPKMASSCVPQDILNLPPDETVDFQIGHSQVAIPVKMLQKHAQIRINTDVLAKTIHDNFMFGTECQLKFVWSGPGMESEIQDLLKEIADKIKILQESMQSASYMLADPLQYINSCVYLMPEGENEEKIMLNAREAAACCVKNGWKYTDRLHIRIWGTQRNR